MRKQRVQYTSALDALLAVAKRLSWYEYQHEINSEEFFDRYSKGELSDEVMFVEWANDYRHFLGLRQDIQKQLDDVA